MPSGPSDRVMCRYAFKNADNVLILICVDIVDDVSSHHAAIYMRYRSSFISISIPVTSCDTRIQHAMQFYNCQQCAHSGRYSSLS